MGIACFYKEKIKFRYVALIVFIATLCRFLPVLYQEVKEPGWHQKNVNEIEFYYDDIARSLIVGKGFVHSVNPNEFTEWKFESGTPLNFVPPLYAFFLFVVYKIFGPIVIIGKFFTCVADGAVCLFIVLIARKIFRNDLISIIASILYTIYPLSIVMSGVLYYQIMMNLALCWLVYCLLSPVSTRNGVWAGVAFGLSSLAKPVTLPLLLIMPLLLGVEAAKGLVSFKEAFKWSAAFLTAGLLVLTPWTVRNFLVFGEFVPVQRGGPEAFFQGSKSEYIDLDVDTLRVKYKDDFSVANKAKKAIQNHIELFSGSPFAYFKFLCKKFGLTWYNTEGKKKNFKVILVQTPFLLLALLGIIVGFRAWIKGRNWLLLGMIFYICGIQVIIFPLVRYTLVVMPFVMILAGVGIVYLLTFKERNRFIEKNFI